MLNDWPGKWLLYIFSIQSRNYASCIVHQRCNGISESSSSVFTFELESKYFELLFYYQRWFAIHIMWWSHTNTRTPTIDQQISSFIYRWFGFLVWLDWIWYMENQFNLHLHLNLSSHHHWHWGIEHSDM